MTNISLVNKDRRPAGTFVSADSRQVLRAFGDEINLKLASADTGGTLTLWENVTPPGGGPPPHYHLNEDELFIVQEGRVNFFLDGQWKEAQPGCIVFAPRGSVHTFRNVGQQTSRMLVLTQPSGFETFFARCAEEFQRPGGPDMERIVAISAEHGIHYLTNSAPNSGMRAVATT